MENVVRLADDAALLRDADRHASAFVLAVIHLEEIGKLIIGMWRHLGLEVSRQEERDHISKQSAAFSLVLAGDLKQGIIDQLGSGAIDPASIEQMAEQAANTNAGVHLVAAQQRLMQRAKHAGLYVDDGEEMIETGEASSAARNFTAEQVNELLRQGMAAVRTISDLRSLAIARAIHKVSRSVLATHRSKDKKS